MTDDLTSPERWLRRALVVLCLVFVGSIAYYLGRGWSGEADYAFVANSVTKDAFFLIFAVLAIMNVRRFGWLTWLVIVGHVVLLLSLLSMIATGNTDYLTNIEAPFKLGDKAFAWVWAAVDAVIALGLTLLYSAARRSPGVAP